METVGVGLLGLGTVGTAVARRLIDEWEMLGERAGATPVLRCVAVRDLSRTRGIDLKNARLLGDPEAVVADPAVAIVVEAIGGTDPATALIESSLRAGKTVVTANKAVIGDVWSSPRARSRPSTVRVSISKRLSVRDCRSSRSSAEACSAIASPRSTA